MSEIEQDILKITEFKAKRKYRSRQDYLAALARSVDKLADEEFDSLEEDSAEWANDANAAIKAKDEIDDFPDLDQEDETEEDPEEDPEEEGEEEEPEEEEAPKRGRRRAAKGKDPKPKAAKGKDKKAKKDKAAPRERKEPTEVNRYGVRINTKVAEAIDMFEEGTTMKEVRETTGGNRYHILKRLESEGHQVEYLDGGIKLTHKDDVRGSKRKSKPSKADDEPESKPAKKKAAGKSSKGKDKTEEKKTSKSKRTGRKVRRG